MLHSLTVAKTFISFMMLLLLLMTYLSLVQCKALAKTENSLQTEDSNLQRAENDSRQFLFLTGVGRETSTPDFIRLVVMRFIYGMASTMGVEDRLEGLFNGAFVPPNADVDLFGLGDFGDSDTGDFDEAAFGGIFGDDDVL